MTQEIAVEPVRVEVHVAAPPGRAFEAFTADFAAWWPRDTHHIGQVPAEEVVLETFEGGRWFERAADGGECDWGRVLAWEPHHRLVLSWQISAHWRFDPDLVTEVELRFDAEGDGTRVRLEHRLLERFGEPDAAVREQLAGGSGWPHLLERFAGNAA